MRLDELGRKKDWTFREKALRRELVTSDNSSSDNSSSDNNSSVYKRGQTDGS